MTNDDNQEGKFIPLNDIPAYIADLKDQLERGSESLGRAAVWMVDAAIDTMRKGEA